MGNKGSKNCIDDKTGAWVAPDAVTGKCPEGSSQKVSDHTKMVLLVLILLVVAIWAFCWSSSPAQSSSAEEEATTQSVKSNTKRWTRGLANTVNPKNWTK